MDLEATSVAFCWITVMFIVVAVRQVRRQTVFFGEGERTFLALTGRMRYCFLFNVVGRVSMM
jgi:hypothetical protein